MEQISIKDLPDGTKEKLTAKAKKKGFTHISSGKGNLAAFIRDWMTREARK